jgi:hypothetical protein
MSLGWIQKLKRRLPSFRKIDQALDRHQQHLDDLRRHWDFEIENASHQRRMSHHNPLTGFGAHCFSQTDEDGITLEIIRRLELTDGIYCEYGVGNGTENNTLVLAALGWRGFWAGGEELAFDCQASERLHFAKAWITAENIASLHAQGLEALGSGAADVISLDLDGNDIYLVRTLLDAGARPDLFMVEYNAKFPPPVRFQIKYDADHVWRGDDYYGASLQSFSDLFDEFGYRCICCNAGSGANAFFIKNENIRHFPEVPKDLREIFVPPHYHLPARQGHPASIEVIRTIFSSQ